MKKYFQSKHLPIPIGLTITMIALVLGIVFIDRARILTLQASPETSPSQIKITNIGSSSFVVSWITADKTTGLVSLGETPKTGEIRKDIRDQDQNSQTSSSLHFVVADNLRPQTKYYFKIVSGDKIYDNNQKPFEVTTATAKVPPDHDIAHGKILTSTREAAAGVIVYLSLANTIPQASLTDSNGNWIIPLSTARTLDLNDFSRYDREAQIEEITVRGEKETASATLSTGNDSPAPDIALGQNYDFLNQLSPSLTPTPVPRLETTEEAGFSPPKLAPPAEKALTITFPAENEQINSPLPEFMGTGPEGESLKVEVESEEKITSQTAADQKGKWRWSPKLPLSSGEHTLTVSYLDANGSLQKATRSFIVLAAGESELPSFTATPSGETVSPTEEPPLPTASPSPVSKPKTSPSPLPTSAEEEESEIPSTGINLPTKFFFGAGLGILTAGILLIVF